MAKQPHETSRPRVAVQIACIVALVALSFIDANAKDFEVNTFVYAIIAGVLLGVGSLKQIFGGKE